MTRHIPGGRGGGRRLAGGSTHRLGARPRCQRQRLQHRLGVLLKPLPYAAPERLVMIWQDIGRVADQREWASPGSSSSGNAARQPSQISRRLRGWMPNLTGPTSPSGYAALPSRMATSPPSVSRPCSDESSPRTITAEAPAVVVVGHELGRDGPAPTQGSSGDHPARRSGRGGHRDHAAVVPAADPRRRHLHGPPHRSAAGPRGIIVLRVMGKLKPGNP